MPKIKYKRLMLICIYLCVLYFYQSLGQIYTNIYTYIGIHMDAHKNEYFIALIKVWQVFVWILWTATKTPYYKMVWYAVCTPLWNLDDHDHHVNLSRGIFRLLKYSWSCVTWKSCYHHNYMRTWSWH